MLNYNTFQKQFDQIKKIIGIHFITRGRLSICIGELALAATAHIN